MRVRQRISQALGLVALAAVFSACDDGGVIIADMAVGCGNNIVDVGEQCDDGNTTDGDGCSSTCQTETDPACGNGTVEGNEGCDDGNTNDGDGCSSTCTVEETPPVCGDGTVNGDEECDDGNTADGDGCDGQCRNEDMPFCGDGNVDDGEECDDGNMDAGDGCDDACQLETEPACGDGNLDDDEECDDGNTDPGDGCDAACLLEPICGDGNLDDGEACDDGNTDGGDGCDADCQLEPVCGDGNLDDGEACDDGNTDNGDGCDERCAIEPECGNGDLEDGEACDDGNLMDGDGCAADCTLEPAVCGDGVIQDGESCDDGNLAQADGCSPDCEEEVNCIIVDDCAVDELCVRAYCVDEAPPVVCGDGFVEGDEQCDDANNDEGDGCDAICQIELPDPVCGNGIVEAPEQCDDGNLSNDDGCSALCQVEGCGNGLIEAGEACDDGNLDAGDGCDADCQIEVICGDGLITGDETCDDGNVDAGDGCDADCQIEPICGNGVVEPGETCDDGNADAGDGCDDLCQLEIVCGNGVVQAGERCDDGNVDAGDGCDPNCQIEDGFVFPLAPLGACVQVGGDLDPMDAVWDRPNANCTAGDGNDHFYEVFRFTNATPDPQFVTAQAAWGGDGYLHIFRDPFAADMLEGCIAGDDDFNGVLASFVEPIEVPPGATIVLVASTFAANAAIGPYTADLCTVPAPERCGDGITQEDNGEECDDGNLDAGDGCDPLCQREPLCGDGFVDGLEECDDGNVDAGDGCDPQCQREPNCGDGFIDAPEQCDDGNVDAGDGCSDVCVFESECGDGEVEGLEQCDDGNLDVGDGCNDSCVLEQPDALDIAERGGTIEIVGSIDEGDLLWNRPSAGCAQGFSARPLDFYRITNNTGADQLLTITAEWAADGYLHVFEDPFNPRDIDGCIVGNDDFNGLGGSRVTNVQIPAGGTLVVVASTFNAAPIGAYTLEVLTQHQCGDGLLGDGVEECDDGNLDNGDGCNDRCLIEAVCGDGAVGLNEECDDGNVDAGDGCDARCQIEPGCGNGRLEGDEACDDGNLVNGDGCSDACEIEIICGDGDLGEGEECDDGNLENGDGCSDACVIEIVCGDGFLAPGEQCDDGNLDAGDGCSPVCEIEAGPIAIAPRDQAINLAGSIDNQDPQWARPSAGCAAEAGADHFFETFTLVNNTGADQTLRLTARWAGGDGYLHVFRRPFQPDALDTCVIGDDDFNGLGGSRIEQVAIAAGEQIIVVASTFNANQAIGDYTLEVYTLPVCGDGDIQGAEECDDGNLDNGDGCSDVCIIEVLGACGDGELNPGEECDDGNLDAGDGCSPICEIEGPQNECGNGVIEAPEECDDGNLDNGDGCDANCVLEAVCGNGAVEAGEQCDDGNLDAGDGCSPACTLEVQALPIAPRDGSIEVQGVIEAGDAQWERPAANCTPAPGDLHFYDLYAVVNQTGAPQQLRITANWPEGDGYLHAFRDPFDPVGLGTCVIGDDDEILDGNPGVRASRIINLPIAPGEVVYIVASTFSANAAIGPYSIEVYTQTVCGDLAVQGAEECDDGNQANGDGCDDQCQIEPACGDGEVDDAVGEECDDGNLDNGDGCDDQCQREPTCGDGFVDAPEQCDDGNLDAGDGCAADCTFEQECGNGELEGTEICDDGNLANGDGCDALCTREVIDLIRGREVHRNATVAGQRDEYRFTVDHTASRLVAFTGDGQGGCPAGNDTLIGLFPVNADGNIGDRIAVNDDGGAGLCSLLERDLAAGNYLLRVNAFANGPLPGYTFDFFLAPDVSAGGDFDGAFVQNGNDVFTFSIDADTDTAFETGDGQGGCPGDTFMTIFPIVDGQRGAPITDDDGGVGVCSRIARVFAAGDYEVEVRGFGDRAIPDYVLQVRFAGVCGDGEINDGEECDDGNVDAGDGCDALCQIEPGCGNGQVDAGEECDDGNLDAGDGCDALCQREQVCGDGFVDDPEACDDGNLDNGDGCDANCQFEQVCGNGAVEGTEECDDGNVDNGDGCDAACTNENFVFAQGIETRQSVGTGIGARDVWRFTVDHDGAVVSAETTDGNGACAGVGDTFMRFFNVNEDGSLGNEFATNDDGGVGFCSRLQRTLNAGDYAVTIEDLGRNGVQPPYTIEFRNTLDVSAGGEFDGAFIAQGNDVFVATFAADVNAAFETGDGNGGCPADTRMNIFPIVDGQRGEPIFDDDDGEGLCSLINQDFVAGTYEIVIDGFNGRAIDAYVLSVTFAGVCGDGEVNVGEACDDGNLDNGDGCDADCQFEVFCGNGNVDAGEECDDGNAVGGDGCDANCQREALCGDGFVDAPETCDDGNRDNGDGCDSDCQVEQTCGNGVVEGDEECDDGNLDNEDGCDADCTSENFVIARGIESRESIGTALGSRDIYRFRVDHANASLFVQNNDGNGGCAGVGDSFMRLFSLNADGTLNEQINTDDDGGPGLCSQITRDADLPVGGYALIIEELGRNAPQPPYTLDFRLTVDVSAGGDFDGAFIEQGDDVFTMTLAADTGAVLETGDGNGACPADTRMNVYPIVDGARGEPIFDDDGGVGLCSRLDRVFTAGTYEIVVDGFNGRAIDAYVLSVAFAGVCGDGVINAGEACDDGNLDNGDGCDDQCQIEPDQVCGNGVLEGTEICDDGNLDNGDGCDAVCTPEVVALLLGREIRRGATDRAQRDDYTFTVDHTQARVVAFTGDGNGGCPANNDTTLAIFPVNADGTLGDRLAFNDDGNGIGLCSRLDVLLDAGDYLIRVQGFGAIATPMPGYVLDYRQTVDVSAGGDFDGAVPVGGTDLFEFTVDADTSATLRTSNGGAGCSGDTLMRVFPVVDGVRGPVLYTDDDGGTGVCSLLTDRAFPAGTYVVEIEEFNRNSPINGYVFTITFPVDGPVCGDGNLEDPEECDDGNLDGGDGCDANCQIEPFCGDGTVDAGEECDDGNNVNGDGCDAVCSSEFFLRNTAITEQNSRMAAGSSDTFRFTLDAPGRVLFFTSDGGFGCPADTRGRMFAVNADGTRGAQIGADIDNGFNPIAPQCAGALRTNIAAGTYEIEVTEQNDGAIAAYQVDLLVAVDAAIESSNQGTLPVGGTDGYYISVEAPTTLAIFTDTAPNACVATDTVMQIFTVSLQTGQLIPLVSDDDGGVGNCSRIQQVFQPGNYAVVINEFDNNAPIGAYNLNVECISCRNAPAPAPGQLQITEVMQNPTAAADALGEYFEVQNTSGTDVDVFGMIIADDGVDRHVVDESVVIPAGAYAVFARNGDPAANGGFDADYVYTDFNLANGDDEVVLLGWRGNELDRVAYDNGATFPDPAGASMQFGGDADDDNNDGSLWCESAVAFGAGDSGSPGEANEGCGGGGQLLELAYQGFAPTIDPIVINVGDTVRWTNNDGAPHTVTSGDPGAPNAGALFDSGNMGQGATFEFTFNQAGQFTYFCRPHAGFMNGYVIQVNDPALN